jgi:6-phosphogluconate dehydrogenase (decarboxylating)
VSKDSLGFVGLGTMGSGIVANLLDAGFPVLAYDRDPAALQAAMGRGAEAAKGTLRIRGPREGYSHAHAGGRLALLQQGKEG